MEGERGVLGDTSLVYMQARGSCDLSGAIGLGSLVDRRRTGAWIGGAVLIWQMAVPLWVSNPLNTTIDVGHNPSRRRRRAPHDRALGAIAAVRTRWHCGDDRICVGA